MTVRKILGPCLFCGAPAAEHHHWTGSLEPDGPRLDLSATVPLCVPCHHAEQATWRALGVDVFSEPLRARIVRMAWLFQRLADLAEQTGPRTTDPESLRGIHDVLLVIVEDLTTRLGWERAS
jgi:hypothetical protein